VWYKDLRVEITAEPALQIGQQAGQGRALAVLRARLLRLVLLNHHQPVWPLVQGVKLNTRFVVDPGDRRLEGRDHLGAVLGNGKGRDDDEVRELADGCPLTPIGPGPGLGKLAGGRRAVLIFLQSPSK